MSLVDSAQAPVIAVVRGRYNAYFGDLAFQHPKIQRRLPISHITSNDQGERTVHFEDGTSEAGVDHLIFGTGFSWTLPFLPQVATRNNRVPDLYQHVFYRHDPSLVFVGAVSLSTRRRKFSEAKANKIRSGWCWIDLQSLRMAGRRCRTRSSRQSKPALHRRAGKMGNRPYRKEERWPRVHSAQPRIRALLREPPRTCGRTSWWRREAPTSVRAEMAGRFRRRP